MGRKEKLPIGIREKNGTYEARATVRGHKITLYGSDLDDLVKRFTEEKEKYKALSGDNSGELTLNDWFELWFYETKVYTIKESSINPLYNVFQRTFASYVGNMKLKDIKPIDIQNAVNRMSDMNMPLKSIRTGLTILNQCLEYANVNGMMEKNPARVIEVPWTFQTHREIVVLTMEEQEKLIEAYRDNWYQEMFSFMLLTGVRVGELGGLKWEDIDFYGKKIYIRRSLSSQYKNGIKKEIFTTPKTSNSVRIIPFVGEVGDVLKTQKEKQVKLKKELGNRYRSTGEFEDLVFVTSMGSPCSRYIVEKEIKAYIKEQELDEAMHAVKEGGSPYPVKHFSPHSLRHTFATRCFEKGIEPKVVQEVMGHSSLSVTMDIYTHVMKDKLFEEMSKFGSLSSDRERKPC